MSQEVEVVIKRKPWSLHFNGGVVGFMGEAGLEIHTEGQEKIPEEMGR